MKRYREIKDGRLYFDGCDTTEIARQYGTPLYVMSHSALMDKINELKEDFIEKYPGARVAYASKAFCTLGMLELLKREGFCLEVVSGGELYVAKEVGFPPERLEFNGNNKLPSEIDDAVSYGVGRIIVDGLKEIPLIVDACKRHGKKAGVMIRVTPEVTVNTHDYISTGEKDSKFGIPLDEKVLFPVVKEAIESEYLDFYGLNMHIGSQLFEVDGFLKALDALMDWAGKIKEEFGVAIREVNFGGGFGVQYTNEEVKPYRYFLDPLMAKLKERADEIGIPCPVAIAEPGRSVVAEAGMTLYTVGQIKEIEGLTKYVSVDGGMGENIRVALYQAEYNGIVANRAEDTPDETVTVCGKYCESGDVLLKDFKVPGTIRMGDIFATYSTGAYGYSMASNYNNNPVPGVVLVKEGKSCWMVKPQTFSQIIENQLIPQLL